MRLSVLPTLAALCLGVLACQGEPLTGPEARAAYSFHANTQILTSLDFLDVREVGFVDHPTIPMSGASPDGLVGHMGLVEIKCPNTKTHIDTLLLQKVPAKYITQMQWQMACTETVFCDYVSYDPRMPEIMRLFVTRIDRNHNRIEELETEVAAFLGEVAEKIAALNNLYKERKRHEHQ